MTLSLAITLPALLQDELGLLRGSLADVRWLPAPQCLIPLQPLGHISEKYRLEELDMALSHLQWEPFPLALHQVGHQPGEWEDRLTVGVTPPRPLAALQKHLGNVLRQAGFPPPRRPVMPELTIARLEPAAPTDLIPWIQRHNLFHSSEMLVDHITLLEHISSNGETHIRQLEVYPAHPGLIMPDITILDDEDMGEIP